MRCRSSFRRWLPLISALALCAIPSPRGPAGAAGAAFVQWLPSTPTTLDPAKSSRIDDDQVMWLLYDGLVQLSSDSTSLLPALAQRWERSADGSSYTFYLRRDVRFHDGTVLDADAVKTSYERQYLKTSPHYSATPANAYERVLADLVKDIRVIDRHTVAISTHHHSPAQFAIVKIVSPRALTEHKGDLSRTPAGTGPFRLAHWKERELLLTAFPDSWHGRPRIDAVRFAVLAENREAVERLAGGEFHLLNYPLPADYFEQLRASPNVNLLKFGGLNTLHFGMLLDRPALKDRRVREAIVRAVNRERLAAVLGRGAMIEAKSILPPNCQAFDPAVSQPAHDLDRARALLREAGVGANLRLTLLYTSPLEIWSEIAHAIRADLLKAGMQVDLLHVPSWSAFHEERKKGTYDLYLYNWSVTAPDPERFLARLYHSKSPDNFSRFASPKVDALLAEAGLSAHEPRRLELYAQVNRLVVEEVPAIFLVHRIGMAGVNKRVKGLTLNLYGLPQDKLARVEIE